MPTSWLLVLTTAGAKEAGSKVTEIEKGTEKGTRTETEIEIETGIERGTGIDIIKADVVAKMDEGIPVVHAALEELKEISETTASR